MNVRQYFERIHQRDVTLVVDDAMVGERLARHGFDRVLFDAHDFSRPDARPVLMVLSTLAGHDRLADLWDVSAGIVAHLALAKFDRSIEAVDYSFDQFLRIDLPDALDRRAGVYAHALRADRVEVTTRAGVLTARFADEVEVANADEIMEPGWLYSVAEFFEASIVNVEADRSSFTVDGVLGFDNFIYLCNKESIREMAGPLFAEMVAKSTRGDNVAWFEDNCLTRLRIGGEDVSDRMMPVFAGKGRGLSATEFAFGCVALDGSQDWTINTPMHEGARGVHVGLAMGLEAPHCDFIARDAKCRYLEADGSEVVVEGEGDD
ncbi:MAG: hypothetical protein R3F65_24710 [bacterium]|nr:hypothetical protein [Myxococcales bacterium]MCB9553274.1 hypothetical protein [Myxococcales bacterium]